MAPKQPEQKTDSKPTPRMIDITQPGGVPASPTARPIIVGHQPAAADPMVIPVSDADSGQAPAETPKQAPAKIVIKPLAPEPEAVAIASSVDGIPVPPRRPSGPVDTDADGMVNATPESTSQAGATPAFVGPLTATPTPAVSAAKPDTEPVVAADREAENADLPGMAKLDSDRQAAEMEAEAKAQDELDGLVDEKTYFLPINAASQRRSRNVFIFGTVLIIILLLAWLNIAMDAGFVTIPGVGPVTNLFG